MTNQSALKKLFAIMVILIFMITPGCSSKHKDEQAKKPEVTQKPPKEFKAMVDQIENMIKELAGLILNDNNSWQLKTEKSKGNEQSQEQGGEGNSDNQSASQGKTASKGTKNEKTETTASQSPMDEWKNMATQLRVIHKNWNMMEPDAIKGGLSSTDRRNFEKALDDLTVSIGKTSAMDSIKAAIELYGQSGSLAKALKNKVPEEYYKTRYEIMAISVEASEGKWDQITDRLPALKDHWDNFKVQKITKNEKMLSRSDLAIDDFEAALASENFDLILIKSEIALNNLKQIEESLSKEGGNQ